MNHVPAVKFSQKVICNRNTPLSGAGKMLKSVSQFYLNKTSILRTTSPGSICKLCWLQELIIKVTSEQACLLLCLQFQSSFYLQPKFKLSKLQPLTNLRTQMITLLFHILKKKKKENIIFKC